MTSLPPFAPDALQRLGDLLAEFSIGWSLAKNKKTTADGADFAHDDGRRASLVIRTPHEPLSKTDTSRLLSELSKRNSGSGKLLILYSHRGFAPGAEKAALNRVANAAVLLAPIEWTERYQVQCCSHSDGVSADDLLLVERCAEAIQESVFGTVPSNHGNRGFESFSVDLRTVSNITFMTQGECGRRRMVLIKEANQSIHLATYNFDDHILADLLGERAQAGIRVRCILSQSKWLKKNPRMADKLRSAGVDVHLVDSHAKCLVIDDGRVLLGSANASPAQRQGVEFNLEMHSPDFARRIVGFLDELLARDSQGASKPSAATDVALPPASP